VGLSLTDRTQRVKVSCYVLLLTHLRDVFSLPYFLSFIQTCARVSYENRHILKFAENTITVSLLHNNESSHGSSLGGFYQLVRSFERGLAADLQCEAASVAGSTLRLPPVSGPEITNYRWDNSK